MTVNLERSIYIDLKGNFSYKNGHRPRELPFIIRRFKDAVRECIGFKYHRGSIIYLRKEYKFRYGDT